MGKKLSENQKLLTFAHTATSEELKNGIETLQTVYRLRFGGSKSRPAQQRAPRAPKQTALQEVVSRKTSDDAPPDSQRLDEALGKAS